MGRHIAVYIYIPVLSRACQLFSAIVFWELSLLFCYLFCTFYDLSTFGFRVISWQYLGMSKQDPGIWLQEHPLVHFYILAKGPICGRGHTNVHAIPPISCKGVDDVGWQIICHHHWPTITRVGVAYIQWYVSPLVWCQGRQVDNNPSSTTAATLRRRRGKQTLCLGPNSSFLFFFFSLGLLLTETTAFPRP